MSICWSVCLIKTLCLIKTYVPSYSTAVSIYSNASGMRKVYCTDLFECTITGKTSYHTWDGRGGFGGSIQPLKQSEKSWGDGGVDFSEKAGIFEDFPYKVDFFMFASIFTEFFPKNRFLTLKTCFLTEKKLFQTPDLILAGSIKNFFAAHLWTSPFFSFRHQKLTNSSSENFPICQNNVFR